jgi:hypothetical protein
MKFLFVCVALAPLLAQSSPPSSISNAWDIRRGLDSLQTQNARLLPLVEQLRPREWVEGGASDTYVRQVESIKPQVLAIQSNIAKLKKDPERLTAALETFLRLDSLQTTLFSVIEGTRKYQNPALADLIGGVLAEGGAARMEIRQYVSDLAELKEQEFKVIEQEAQRCRISVTRQPRPLPVPRKPPEKAAQ